MLNMTTDYDALFESARALSESAAEISRRADDVRRTAVLTAIAGGVSQGEIARKLGVTRQRVAQIINNTR